MAPLGQRGTSSKRCFSWRAAASWYVVSDFPIRSAGIPSAAGSPAAPMTSCQCLSLCIHIYIYTYRGFSLYSSFGSRLILSTKNVSVRRGKEKKGRQTIPIHKSGPVRHDEGLNISQRTRVRYIEGWHFAFRERVVPDTELRRVPFEKSLGHGAVLPGMRGALDGLLEDGAEGGGA